MHVNIKDIIEIECVPGYWFAFEVVGWTYEHHKLTLTARLVKERTLTKDGERNGN